MIYCNLAVLLAERSLKITKVSKDTGISRTTLTSLSNNKSQGMQFETFNKLCMYLNVSPERLMQFIPYDFEIALKRFHRPPMFTDDFDISIIVSESKKKHFCSFIGRHNLIFKNTDEGHVLSEINVDVELSNSIDEDKIVDTLFGYKLIKELSPSFQMDIGEMITDEMRRIMCWKPDDIIFDNVTWFDNSNDIYLQLTK